MNIIGRVWESAMDESKKTILSWAERNASTRLLDLGCYTGEFTTKLSSTIGTREIYGVEASEQAIHLAEERGIRVYPYDLNMESPLDSEAFDVVHASHIIEHLYRTDTFVKEIYRILKPGGYLLIATPNLAAFPNIVCLVLGWQPPTAQVSDEVYIGNPVNPKRGRPLCQDYGQGHLRIFTRRALTELLQHHGFMVERATSVGYLPAAMNRPFAFLFPRHGINLVAKARKI